MIGVISGRYMLGDDGPFGGGPLLTTVANRM
jgi:hypothetical protein